jgi:hypothetical protein
MTTPNRPPLSPAARAIREAVNAVFARSPVPPTTEDVAAALRAASTTLTNARAADALRANAAELESNLTT